MDATELRHDAGRIARCFEHGVAEDRIERGIAERQPSTIGYGANEVVPSDCGCVAAGSLEAIVFEINADHPASCHRLGKTQCDRSLAATTVEHDHIVLQVWEQKGGVNLRAPRIDRGFGLDSVPRLLHVNCPRRGRGGRGAPG